MVIFSAGNILEEEVEALVNTVNCVGIMGRGLALQFKNRYPDNFEAYAEACKNKEVQPGQMFISDTKLTFPRFIINFPTKRHWRDSSQIEDIYSGLMALVEEVKTREIKSIAIPPLGCGLGGLSWYEVLPIIETFAKNCSQLKTVIFKPR